MSETSQATHPDILRERIMDSRIAKSEAEWWAASRIAELEAEVAESRRMDGYITELMSTVLGRPWAGHHADAATILGSKLAFSAALSASALQRALAAEAKLKAVEGLSEKWKREVRDVPNWPADLFTPADMLECARFWADGCASELESALRGEE